MNNYPIAIWLQVIVCFIPLLIYGQDYRAYEDGVLAYEDFRGEILETENSNGAIYLDLILKDSAFVFDGIKIYIPFARAIVLTKHSWLNYDKGADNFLDYFQVLFDIQHLYAKKINKLAIENPLENSTEKSRFLFNEMNIVSEKMRSESDFGLNTEMVKKWSLKIKEEISDVETKMEEHILNSDFGIDFNMGVSYNLKGSDLKNTFGNSIGLSIGLNFNIKSYYLIMAGSLGFKKMRSTLTDHPFWDEGVSRKDNLINLAIGKKINFKKIRIVPFIGASIHTIYINKDDYKLIYPSTCQNDWNIGGGIFIDYPLFSKYGNFHQRDPKAGKALQEHGIRIMIKTSGNTGIYNHSGFAMAFSINYYYYLGNLKNINPN